MRSLRARGRKASCTYLRGGVHVSQAAITKHRKAKHLVWRAATNQHAGERQIKRHRRSRPLT